MPISLPLFFAKPERVQLRISPLGRWLAWLARDPDTKVLNIWIQSQLNDANGKKKMVLEDTARQITFATDRDMCRLFTFSMDDKYLLYLRDTQNGNELYHLHAIDLEAQDPWSTSRDLIQDPKMTVAIGFVGNTQIWRPSATPREIIIATGKGSLFWDISRLNLDTGDLRLVERNPMSSCSGILSLVSSVLAHYALRLVTCGVVRTKTQPIPAVQWFPDRQKDYQIRGRTQMRILPNVSVEWAIKNSQGRWETMQSMKLLDLNLQLIGGAGGAGTARMDFDGDSVSMHSCLERDTTCYSTYNLSGPDKFDEKTCLAWSSKADIKGFLCHPETGKPQVVYFEEDKMKKYVLDEDVLPDLEYIEGKFPDLEVTVLDRSINDTTWVVLVDGDRCPGDYYLYDRSRQVLTFVFASRPKLAGMPLARQQPLAIQTRDGESLSCYLSRPDEYRAPGPMVLWIHGGPMARDSWEFNPEVQLLCSRGMAVLQVNYRSSIGFGRRFMRLPYGNLDTVREDIAEATRWARSSGIADPSRIAIGGASWGGYLSLRGMTTDAALYAGGLALVPVSSIGAAGGLSFRGDPLIKMYWDEMYGPDVRKNKAAAMAVSPLFHADKIEKPLMVATCLKDPRVKPEQGAAIVDAVKKRGIPCYFVTYADEGHGLRKERNLLDFWRRAECFLCRCLSLPQPPPPDESWTCGSSAKVEWNSMEGMDC
eukprot:TRINITY_DN26565_c0_g3_i1.p1 TRINITY_DN26565_c0_g3~~TRINITY_DN26565_c0_g3_i1.p1  ORF type:complete len:724 (+),score=61.06 TRINITY_DN26565_c0_g3_i1:54-2174(+)